MDPQQLLATLIQLSDEQQHRIAELLNQLEQQTRTLTTASQRAAQAANALDHNGQKTALHLQAAVQQSVETTLHDTLTTLSQRAEGAFQEAGRPLLHTLTRVTKAAEETEERLQRAVKTFQWQWGVIAGGAALAAVVVVILGVWLAVSTLVSWQSTELERLNTAIAQSEARLAELNRRGGKIELTDCGGRLCAYASTNQGEGYTDWKTPWTGKNGLPVVILRGY
jgi:cell division septum initiation protein DivIVA